MVWEGGADKPMKCPFAAQAMPFCPCWTDWSGATQFILSLHHCGGRGHPRPLAEGSLPHPCHPNLHSSLLAHTLAIPRLQHYFWQGFWNEMILQAGALRVRNTARLRGWGWQGTLKPSPLCKFAVFNKKNERGWELATWEDVALVCA